MFFFAIIRFRASANISLNLFLRSYLFWLLHLSQKISILFLFLIFFLFSISSSIKFSLLQLILYLKEYVLLCYAILRLILQKIADWLTYSNTSFWWSFVLISALYIYRIISWLVPKFVRGLDKDYFLFFKILQFISQKNIWRVIWLLWQSP